MMIELFVWLMSIFFPVLEWIEIKCNPCNSFTFSHNFFTFFTFLLSLKCILFNVEIKSCFFNFQSQTLNTIALGEGIAPDINPFYNSVHSIFSDSGISILKDFQGRQWSAIFGSCEAYWSSPLWRPSFLLL